MRQFRRSTVAALAGLGTLAIAVAPGFAGGGHQGARDAGPAQGTAAQVQLAHMSGGGGAQGQGGPGMMGRGYGSGPGYGVHPGYGMGPGSGMGPGMMGPCQGYGMGPGQGHGMGPGQGYGMGPGQGYGMGPGQGYGMGPGQGYGMGPGTGYGMGPGQGYGMGPGMMGPGYGPGAGYGMGPAARPDLDLSADDVRARLEGNLTWHGNKRLKVGDVTETDDDTITADIVTQDGSLAQRFKIDRHSGQMQQAE